MNTWKRNCQNCNSDIFYSNRCNWNRGNRTNALCYTCANEKRKGRKRTVAQCNLISEKTKLAMSNPDIITKIKTSMALPEVKQKMSENGRRQMESLKLDADKYNIWKLKQKNKQILQWKNLSDNNKSRVLKKLQDGFSKKWNNPAFRKEVSDKMKGVNNPFYGKKHSSETIEKLRKATTNWILKFWNTPGIHGFNTKPEQEIKKILVSNNIDFITPFPLKHKLFDLYLPKYNLIIEVDGCYWHSKGILLENMNEQQLRRWKNDRYKDSLAIKNGYKIMRIWEDEINVTNVLERIYTV